MTIPLRSPNAVIVTIDAGCTRLERASTRSTEREAYMVWGDGAYRAAEARRAQREEPRIGGFM
jgi:hypothetical protein